MLPAPSSCLSRPCRSVIPAHGCRSRSSPELPGSLCFPPARGSGTPRRSWHRLQTLTPCAGQGCFLSTLPNELRKCSSWGSAWPGVRSRWSHRGFRARLSPIRAPRKAQRPRCCPELCPQPCTGGLAELLTRMPKFLLLSPSRGAAQRVPSRGGLVRGRLVGCRRLGSTRGAQRQQGLAGTHKAEPGIDFLSIPCNHILQRLLSYISIPHLCL